MHSIRLVPMFAALTTGTALTLSTAVFQGAAAADSFYKGKKLKMIIRSAAGGGYDFYARLVLRHITRHIPGKPTGIPVNMEGASGIVATNYLMQRAKRDGTEMAIVSREIATQQRLGTAGVKYDVRKLIAIGSAASLSAVYVIKRDHPINSMKDLRRFNKEVKFGAQGRGGGSYQRIMLLKIDGMPVRPITGYAGTDERVLALARGDVIGLAASYDSLKEAIKDQNLKIVAYLGNKLPVFGNAPHIRRVLTSATARQLSNLVEAPLAAGRPFMTTPGVPKDRVAILRAAFKAALQDPKLQSEAKRAGRPIAFTNATDMGALYQRLMSTPDDVIKTFRKEMLSKGSMVKHSGPVTKIVRKGRSVSIKFKGKVVTTKISKSRTKVMINGKSDKRSNIKAGMTCTFNYPGNGSEAKSVDCKS